MSGDILRALVVEDERAWQEVLTEILADVGLAVDVAEDYETAVACLRRTAHRLTVVDLSLNEMDYQNQDGLRVLDAVRRYDPGCAAVLLTGFATVEIAVSALNEHGALTCLRKESFRRAQFREVLQQALVEGGKRMAIGSLQAEGAALPGSVRPAGAPELVRTESPEAAEAGCLGTALLVEDDAGWRTILADILASAGYRVRACTSYGEALGSLRREKYRLAVVDLSLANSLMPGVNSDGCQVLEKAQGSGIPAIVVSGQGTREGVERAYAEYGIFAFIEKQSFERAAFLATVAEATEHPVGEDPLAGLTRREREVLALLAQGLTNKGIANSMVISTNTVKRYLKSIFEKLDVDSRAAATAKAVSAGLTAGHS
jgi:DNA-binding NarL/FixJ family response regulator